MRNLHPSPSKSKVHVLQAALQAVGTFQIEILQTKRAIEYKIRFNDVGLKI